MTLMLAEIPPIAINFMVIGFFLVCLIMILTVLIQKPQGGGLAGAFGSGAGSGQTAFGARTGDALTVATIGIFVFYILAAVGLNFVVRPTIAAPPEVTATSTEETPAPGTPSNGTTTTPTPSPTPSPVPTPAPTPAPAPTPEGGAAPSVPPAAEPPATEPATPPASPATPPATPPTTPG